MITLPSNTLWVSADLAVAIVPGRAPGYPSKWPAKNRPGPWRAPQEWAQYDKPCEATWQSTAITCSVCYGTGRQVWEVRWPDPAYYSPPNMNWLSARATLQVVPVVAKPSDSPTQACLCPAARGMVMFWHDREPITVETTPDELHSRADLIGPFDPLPVVGQDFAAVVRKVTM